MTPSTLKNQVRKISLSLVMALTLLTVAACGGGGGSGGGGGNHTAATLKINLTGSLPASTAISGAGFILILPANVTAATTGGVALSGTFAGSTFPPQVLYTPATSTTPGTIKVILSISAAAGVTQVGEVATVTLQLANGAAPTAASFGVSEASVIDAGLFNPINGMGVSVAAVTLQ